MTEEADCLLGVGGSILIGWESIGSHQQSPCNKLTGLGEQEHIKTEARETGMSSENTGVAREAGDQVIPIANNTGPVLLTQWGQREIGEV